MKPESTKTNEAEAERFELKVTLKQLDFMMKDLHKLTKQWEDRVSSFSSRLDKSLENLEGAYFSLNQLPDRMNESITDIVKSISNEISSSVFSDFNKNLSDCSSRLSEFIAKAREVEDLPNRRIKTTALSIIAILTLVIIVSATTIYYTSKSLPKHVGINGNEVTIKDSSVTVWGKSLKVIEEERVQHQDSKAESTKNNDAKKGNPPIYSQLYK